MGTHTLLDASKKCTMPINNRSLRGLILGMRNDEIKYNLKKEIEELKQRKKKSKTAIQDFLEKANDSQLIDFYNSLIGFIKKKQKKKVSYLLTSQFKSRSIDFSSITSKKGKIKFKEIVFLKDKRLVFINEIGLAEANKLLNNFIARNDPNKEVFSPSLSQITREKVTFGMSKHVGVLNMEPYRLAHTYIRKEVWNQDEHKVAFFYLVIKKTSLDVLFPFDLQVFFNLAQITTGNKNILVKSFMANYYVAEFIDTYLKPFGLVHKKDYIIGAEVPHYYLDKSEAKETEVSIDQVDWIIAKNKKQGNTVEYNYNDSYTRYLNEKNRNK